MCANRVNLESDKEIISYPPDAELSSFVQNIVAVESIMFRIELEMARVPPDINRLQIFMSDAQSLVVELRDQARRAIAVGGREDPNVLRFEGMKASVALIAEGAEKRVALAVLEGDKAESELKEALADGQARHDKLVAERRPDDDPVQFDEKLAANTAQTLARLAEIRVAAEARMNGASTPPIPPVDTPKKSEDDDSMDARLTALEKDMALVKADVGVIRATMATKDDVHVVMNGLELIKADATTMKGTFATKVDLTSEVGSLRTDIAKMEATILRWFIATAFTIAGLAFAAAKLIR